MQILCQATAMKFTSIAEPQPILSKYCANKNQPASQQADCQAIKTDGVYNGFYAVAKVILIFEVPTKYFRFQQFVNIEQKKASRCERLVG